MLFNKIFKSIFCKPRYYHPDYGFYTIQRTWMRKDYNKKDALILTDDGLWYKLPYEWLIRTSITK